MFPAASRQTFGHDALARHAETEKELPSKIENAAPANLQGQSITVVGSTVAGGSDGGASLDVPEGSGGFQSELAAIMDSYAEQIAAAQMFYPAAVARGIVQRLTNERTVAVRNLMERRTAEQKNKQAPRPSGKPPVGPDPPLPKPGL